MEVYTTKNAQVAVRPVTCCNNLLQQADIRMRSHGLRQLVYDKSIVSCQQTSHKLIVKTCYPQACFKLFQYVLASLQMTNYYKLVKTDLLKLDKIDKFVATF